MKICPSVRSLKDKSLIENRSGVKYKYGNCIDCKQDYLRETARSFKHCFAEHQRHRNMKSPVKKISRNIAKHLTGLKLPFWAISMIGSALVCTRPYIMKIDPALNENKGCFEIPKVYHHIVLDPGGEGEEDPLPEDC